MGVRLDNWHGVSMDLSMCAVQDVYRRHFNESRPPVLTIRVGLGAWDYARMDVAKWNQSNAIAPVGIVWNLYLDPSLEGHDWTIEDDDLQILVKAA
jgi:hypothetical protein